MYNTDVLHPGNSRTYPRDLSRSTAADLPVILWHRILEPASYNQPTLIVDPDTNRGPAIAHVCHLLETRHRVLLFSVDINGFANRFGTQTGKKINYRKITTGGKNVYELFLS